MRQLLRLFSLCILVISQSLLAQDRCGMEGMPASYAERIRLADEKGLRTDTLYQIPVVFHLVALNNGSGRAQPARVLPVLCELNTQFAPAGIRFFLAPDGIRLVNNSAIFSQHHLNLNQQALRALRADSAINIFVVQNAGPIGEQNVVGYFDVGDDWIVLRRDMLKSGNNTLAHEFGHFFGLAHPHLGWESQAWTQNLPAPLLASDGLTETERADGSNCPTAGDRLCDTPADYNNGLDWQQSCQFADTVRDPAGMPINPDEQLIMSYFNDSCRTIFSPQQLALLQANLLLPSRGSLLGKAMSDEPLSGPPLLLQPVDTTIFSGDSLSFRWNAPAQATRFVVEIDRSATFDLDPRTVLTNDTSIWLSGNWLPGQQYYWRVIAYQPGNTCTPAAQPVSFLPVASPVGLGQALPKVTFRHWQKGGNLFLLIEPDKRGRYEVEMIDFQGRMLLKEVLELPPGQHTLAWNLSHLPPGWYFFRWKDSRNVHFIFQIP